MIWGGLPTWVATAGAMWWQIRPRPQGIQAYKILCRMEPRIKTTKIPQVDGPITGR
jgi:hypothetical protein